MAVNRGPPCTKWRYDYRLDMKNRIHPTWLQWLTPYFQDPSFGRLQVRLNGLEQSQIYPPQSMRYAALETDPSQIKVVILGQDPYHGAGQAMGLAFSVPPGVSTPRSLGNIYKEIEAEGGQSAKGRRGDLTPWVDQGVLLLNTALSVESGQPASHRGWGWEGFTDGVIKELSQHRENLIFLLWGGHAQEKAPLIEPGRGHLILTSPHPSPLSARRGFFGCGHFKKANDFLIGLGEQPIDW